MKKYTTGLLLTGAFILLTATAFRLHAGEPPRREYYELKIYHLENSIQEERVDRFLEEAYIPALHRAGIEHVGVFKPVEDTSQKKIYVFIPYRDLRQMETLEEKLAGDNEFASAGRDYLEAAYDDPAYKRIERIFLKAFPKMPRMALPNLDGPKSERIYELRSYEGPSEKLYKNKVRMFNEGGETVIFNRLGFNAVFYAEVLAGSHMPNLMYMTTFSDKASRDKHWEAFRDDPAWKKLSSMEEYQHNVSHSDIIFLKPVAYSDI